MAEEPWTGQKIILKRIGTEYRESDQRGREKVVGILTDINYTVLDDRDGRVKVSQQSVEGWLNKNEVVLLDNAEEFFGKELEANSKDVVAWHARGVARHLKGNREGALADLSDAIRLDPITSRWLVSRGLVYRANKSYPESLRDFEKAIELSPTDPAGFNKAAWLLATCPDAKHRDGKRGILLATKACEITQWKRPGHIDSLAAAYAEAGQFDEAIRYQSKALEDPGYVVRHGAWAKKLLEGYRRNEPYRED